MVKAFEKQPQGDARFPPGQTHFQTFLSVETLAASARGERLGCKARQTSLGKTLFPQLTEEAILKTEVKTVPTAPPIIYAVRDSGLLILRLTYLQREEERD